MSNVILEKGFSYYKQQSISDRQLCDLVGLETYKALYQLFPDIWLALTYPMTASEDHLQRIQCLLIEQDDLSGVCLKKRLVVRAVDGPTQSASELVAGLISSSARMEAPTMEPLTNLAWITWMVISIVLTVLVVYFYVWPDLKLKLVGKTPLYEVMRCDLLYSC